VRKRRGERLHFNISPREFIADPNRFCSERGKTRSDFRLLGGKESVASLFRLKGQMSEKNKTTRAQASLLKKGKVPYYRRKRLLGGGTWEKGRRVIAVFLLMLGGLPTHSPTFLKKRRKKEAPPTHRKRRMKKTEGLHGFRVSAKQRSTLYDAGREKKGE